MIGLLLYVLYIVICDTILSPSAPCSAQEPQRALFCCLQYNYVCKLQWTKILVFLSFLPACFCFYAV